MARYKQIDTSPRLLPADLSKQLLPGTFEHALNELLDHDLDLSDFDARYRNDATGATAYPPAMLLKVILFAYSRGIVSSRAMERACREQVTFIALSGDSAPHFTTVADFVSGLGTPIAGVFTQVLFIGDAQGLIGREMFAIDGVKLPSDASKTRSGTRAEFERQAVKIESAVAAMLTRHRAQDMVALDPDTRAKEQQRVQRLERDAAQLRHWLLDHPDDRRGAKDSVRKSNRTDNESAKMATGKGVIQGYTGVAAVDAQCQIIVEAQAHGSGSEQEMLVPMVEAMRDLLDTESLITADAGYHSAANLQALAARGIEALIADNGMRQRDQRFDGQGGYKTLPHPLHDKGAQPEPRPRFGPHDFRYDASAHTCICPAGQQLYRHGRHCVIKGHVAIRFEGAQRDCVPCPLRSRCLRHPERTKTRQVAFFQGRAQNGYRVARRDDEAAHRQPRGTPALRATLRHRGTGVRQPASQQAAATLHTARTD